MHRRGRGISVRRSVSGISGKEREAGGFDPLDADGKGDGGSARNGSSGKPDGPGNGHKMSDGRRTRGDHLPRLSAEGILSRGGSGKHQCRDPGGNIKECPETPTIRKSI